MYLYAYIHTHIYISIHYFSIIIGVCYMYKNIIFQIIMWWSHLQDKAIGMEHKQNIIWPSLKRKHFSNSTAPWMISESQLDHVVHWQPNKDLLQHIRLMLEHQAARAWPTSWWICKVVHREKQTRETKCIKLKTNWIDITYHLTRNSTWWVRHFANCDRQMSLISFFLISTTNHTNLIEGFCT